MTQQTIPEGYMQDSSGRLYPVNLISPIDKQRDELVAEIVGHAQAVNEALAKFKNQVWGDIDAFVQLSAEKYNAQMGGQKGNLVLMSFDGRYKVQRQVSEKIVFDERLQIAKELIDECIHKWSKDSGDEIRALIEHAFQTDRAGKINVQRILGLMKLDIKDEGWKNAMEAIKDSIQVAGSKSYVRVYERIGNTDNYKAIVLDLAAV